MNIGAILEARQQVGIRWTIERSVLPNRMEDTPKWVVAVQGVDGNTYGIADDDLEVALTAVHRRLQKEGL